MKQAIQELMSPILWCIDLIINHKILIYLNSGSLVFIDACPRITKEDMTSKQFRATIMIIILLALVEIVVGVFYYFVFFTPKRQMEIIEAQKNADLVKKQIEQDRILKEAKIKASTRMEEIKLEVKKIDLEQARIKRWLNAGKEFEDLRREEEEKKGKEASMESCMKIVVENYHNQWNLFCEELNLPNDCYLPNEKSEEINNDYETGKAQCENFFK